MKPDAIERMECSHHKFCCRNDNFSGCEKCRDFEYSRQDWLRYMIEQSSEVVVPYDYDIYFNRRVSLFTISKGGMP